MAIRWELKQAVVNKFGSQVEAAAKLGWRESRLSYLIRGHVRPTDQERKALESVFGELVATMLLDDAASERIQNAEGK